MAPEEMELPDTRREVSSLVIKAYVVSLLLLLSVLVWSVGDAWAQYAHDVFAPAYSSHFAMPLKALTCAVTQGRRRRSNAFFGCYSKVGVLGMVLSIGKFFSFCKLLVTSMKIVTRSPYSQPTLA